MTTESEIEFFSVTPLEEQPVVPAAPPGSARRLPIALAQAAAWLVAAALAVGASFAPLYRIQGRLPDDTQLSGNLAQDFQFYVDGWGRPRLHDTGSLSVDDALDGPRFGIAFCACAALMLLAAVLVVAGPRLLSLLGVRGRLLSVGRLFPAPGITGALLLAGSAGSAALSELPIRKQVRTLSYESFGLGWSLGLAGLSVGVGVLVWGWDRLSATRAEGAAPASPAGRNIEARLAEDLPLADEPRSTIDVGRPEPDLSAWRPPVDRLE